MLLLTYEFPAFPQVLVTLLLQGQRLILIRQLTRRFGLLHKSTEDQLGQLAADELEELSDQLPSFETLESVEAWLGQL